MHNKSEAHNSFIINKQVLVCDRKLYLLIYMQTQPPIYHTQPLQIIHMDHSDCGCVYVLSPTDAVTVWANMVSLGHTSTVCTCNEHLESGQAMPFAFSCRCKCQTKVSDHIRKCERSFRCGTWGWNCLHRSASGLWTRTTLWAPAYSFWWKMGKPHSYHHQCHQ